MVDEAKIIKQAEKIASNVQKSWYETLNPIERSLDYASNNPGFKKALLRFVDVLPALDSNKKIKQAFNEYFDEEDIKEGWGKHIKYAINTLPAWSVGYVLKKGVNMTAQRFMAGFNQSTLLNELHTLSNNGYAFSVDKVGEDVLSAKAADRYADEYTTLIKKLDSFDANQASISIKPTALCARFNPSAPTETINRIYPRLKKIIEAAQEKKLIIYFDMETDQTRNITLSLIKKLLQVTVPNYERLGIVIQSYHTECLSDADNIINWLRNNDKRLHVRLVKGAYWNEERAQAFRRNWPIPVYENKGKTDSMYEKLAHRLVNAYPYVKPAFGSHNIRSLACGTTLARQADIPDQDWEVQMLYGMGRPIQRAVKRCAIPLRLYVPYGKLLPGMGYLVRRLLENTANQSFLQNKIKQGNFNKPDPDSGSASKMTARGYKTIGPRNYSRPHTIEKQSEEYKKQVKETTTTVPVLINGQTIKGDEFDSHNPSYTSQIVGKISHCKKQHIQKALKKTPNQWGASETRADAIEAVGDALQNRRYELSALITRENGKNWTEADADVMEAIDFCYYYAQQARKIKDERNRDVPGEINRYQYRPYGPAAIIAPWNFPLAILTGMTTAALVAGNPVFIKPAMATSTIAWEFVRCLRPHVPDEVVHFLPGSGKQVGERLVKNPTINTVAFTGSRSVGNTIRGIVAQKDETVMTRTVLEMGGKNAIIVGPSADIDKATAGIIESAFGYQGQKCSACSRVIVHKNCADELQKRLRGAAKALSIKPADNPDCDIGPVINNSAKERLEKAKKKARSEGRVVYDGSVPKNIPDGHYVAPLIVKQLSPQSDTMQNELFGPILGITTAESIDQAIKIANNVDYALTGGLYSRMPSVINKVKQQFEVGNLYINRDITGAVVGRQPFGGFKQSGKGTKAGGPDYLKHFMLPKTITENITRKGYPGQE